MMKDPHDRGWQSRPNSPQIQGMNKTFDPSEHFFMIRWADLEQAWKMLASPDKLLLIPDALETMQVLDRYYGQERAVFNMIAATAWLTDDGPCSRGGWKP